MTNLLIGILAAAISTNQPVALSNLIKDTTGLSVSTNSFVDPEDKELDELMHQDNLATSDVDRWIRENNDLKASGGALKADVLNAKILSRYTTIRTGYKDFIAKHPQNTRAMLAYGSFLTDLGEEEASIAMVEKAREIDPKNPAAWNQAANYYGHRGPITNAFIYYAKAIELETNEAIYYQNFATTVFLFRKDAMEFYKIDEQGVFNKALELYKKATDVDPDNFELAQDVAQTYYGIRPYRIEAALGAWTNALRVATTEIEKEGVYIHFARLNNNVGRTEVAKKYLSQVTNEVYDVLKNRLLRNIATEEEKQKDATTTNSTSGGTNISITSPAKSPETGLAK
jgi:tetratricopeptide (TPR) repeat protein